MTATWKTVRVFISSTFRDMQAERDHLVRFVFPKLRQELLLRRNVKLLLHTRFVDVRVSDGGRITECIICGKSGPEALRAKQFIDCTGDADVARRAGFKVMKGRPEDGLQLPMSMMSFVRHVEEDKAGGQLPAGWFQPCRSPQELPMTSVWPNGPGSNALKVKIPMFDSTDTESLTAAEIRARRRAWEVLDYYQRRKAEPWRYDGCSPQIGIREGARIVGDYVLNHVGFAIRRIPPDEVEHPRRQLARTAPDAFDGVHMKSEWLSDGAGAWGKPYMRGYVGGGTGVFTQALLGVHASSPSDVWAVGGNGVAAHFDGTDWTLSSTGSASDLLDVWASGPYDL